MKKERKVGIRFDKVKSKKYVYVNYKGDSTRFKYNFFNEIKSSDAEEFIKYSVRYLDSTNKNFRLKGLGDKIYTLSCPIKQLIGLDYFINKLGDILSHNQFMYLAENSSNLDCCLYHALNDFFDDSNLSNSKLKDLNVSSITEIIDQLGSKDIVYLKCYHLVNEFECLRAETTLNWLTKTKIIVNELESFYEMHKNDISESINYYIPKKPSYNFRDVSIFIGDSLSAIKETIK